ncbi:DUF2799 domain-containing protein [Caulobacter sp. 1776]|uniref:DUF2799 domain-containing protein n=1 Tax=Caulobacter sp. 1776 TaxID=3156420 RepID=UPI003398D942
MHRLAMRSLLVGVLVVVAAVVTSSCATMSKEDCQVADWRAVGDRDGGRGAPASKIDAYGKACAKAGVTPDASLYEQGRDQGLTRYCTEANGFWEGRQGRTYANVCPASAEAEFLPAFADGERVYAATHRLEMAKSDLSIADSRAEKRARQADDVEEELRNPKLTEEQTRELRDRLARLRRERREAIEDGRRAEAAIRDAEIEVDEVRRRLMPRYGYF